ncbi:MAG: sulfatase-like hydrolase/transferase [Planctomycetes bacterium]|nr:sulfatase-like hydrolase/transferase [Planctomycetota bacterium]
MSTKPHIIIFNPDQWRADFMGHHDHPAVKTPHLDAFVEKDAVSFRHAFCQNPVCTPSRCSFMTGLYPHTKGHRSMLHSLHTERGDYSLLQLLKEDGYKVFWGGKNDLIAGQNPHSEHCDIYHQGSEAECKKWGYTPRESHHGGSEYREDESSSMYYSFLRGELDKGDEDIYCDSDWQHVLAAIDLINNHDGDQPLCIYLPIEFPHPPYACEKPWYGSTDRTAMPAPRGTGQDKAKILDRIRERQHIDWSDEQWQELRGVYADMCSRVDYQFNLLMEALQKNNMYDDSAVFLFADHGDYTGDYGLVEKNVNTFEDCLSNVPLIVKAPKTQASSPGIRQQLVELVDFSATVCDWADIQQPHNSFGRSLSPLMHSDDAQGRDAVFCEGGRRKEETHYVIPQSATQKSSNYWPRASLFGEEDNGGDVYGYACMCRSEDFKYIKRIYDQDEFYDLRSDPQELINLINDPHYADDIMAHKERTLQWFMETADIIPFEHDSRGFVQQ